MRVVQVYYDATGPWGNWEQAIEQELTRLRLAAMKENGLRLFVRRNSCGKNLPSNCVTIAPASASR